MSPTRRVAAVRLLLADDHAKQSGLPGAVGADNANDPAARQVEAEVFHQEVLAIALADILGPDDQVAEVRTGRHLEHQFILAFLVFLRCQFLVLVQTCLALGDTRARRHVCPFQLAYQGLAAG